MEVKFEVGMSTEHFNEYTVRASECFRTYEQDKKNVKLIEAAPALLAALFKAENIISGEYPEDDEIAAPVLKEIRAAITKAYCG